MQLWRFGRGWTEAELRQHLADLSRRQVSFQTPVAQMTRERGWFVDGAHAVIGREPPGEPLPGGLFVHARQALVNYDFSDPRIVEGHFDPAAPLLGRDMLLEIKVLGLRFLNGVRVLDVRSESGAERTIFGYRYDTLEGHFEQGLEWFLLSKDHASGEVSFRIQAHWRLDEFPTWWSRLGFLLVGSHFRELWRRRAIGRLRRLVRQPAEAPVAEPGHLAHRGDAEATPTR